MKQYFNAKTGEQALIGKPFKVSVTENGYTSSFETTELVEPMAEMLVTYGILTYKKPVIINTSYDYYVSKLAGKLKMPCESCVAMLNALMEYSPSVVFTLLSKQIALELDAKYEGHIVKSKELYGVDLTTGYIIPIKIKSNTNFKNVSLFRSVEDAMLAVNILKPVYNRMF